MVFVSFKLEADPSEFVYPKDSPEINNNRKKKKDPVVPFEFGTAHCLDN